jgi:HEAT repeat protein
MRVSIVNDYAQPTFTAGLWVCAKEGNERAAVICRKLCETAATDEEIGNLAITAVAEGAAEMLLLMCKDLLASDLAKQRALAVSLLAWVALDAAVDRLRQLVQNDVSGWVRTHAAWALEVAQHERAIRQYYRDTLKVTDINTLLSRLQVLLPALTVSTASWHRQVEDEELEDDTSKQIEAALSGFWYNFRHRSKTPPKKVLNRDLREYLRGECIRDLRAPKPRLLDIEGN